jgi:hypothetical protein
MQQGYAKVADVSCHAEPVRCPFCVQGDGFRQMVDLTGGAGGTFYCTTCRHLVRQGDREFHCLCANCRALSRFPAGR